jgi:hypothetical protein
MTCLSACKRALWSPLSVPVFLVLSCLALVTTVSVTGCADNHIGRPCEIGVDKSAIDPTKATVNPAALECPSRLCLLPAQNGAPTMNVQGLCSAECSSNDDCSDGEKGTQSASNTRCVGGFSCRVVFPPLSSVGLSCKSLCVCNDFLSAEDKANPTKPKGCM